MNTANVQELDGGKLRLCKLCAHCGREVWGIFVWRGEEAMFTCDREEHLTEYEPASQGWVARAAAAA